MQGPRAPIFLTKLRIDRLAPLVIFIAIDVLIIFISGVADQLSTSRRNIF
jgi:hypothetical protein